MVEVKESICHCGKCGKEFPLIWELEAVDVSDGGMDVGTCYYGEAEGNCPVCNNRIEAALQATEKPIGVLEDSHITKVEDSENTGLSTVKIPEIFLFDI